ncbi:nucleotide-binding universal stress UspA family protein [Actinoplanes lutulentus]|uniref:Universal stress protein family protein n=1 Tax=Actinoplanes lutulentus TaxID=1287878 RepID=A0A327ZKY9_9ACTN|nr:universal stress protein [Actinoplanes lutulentus]MBB2944081.1 nucleotide-binding universal stress UspA family protein [Actinoplanes lutulentus]RAK42686.1 universal stress protein family protein [Actinoplanes lutulentus]
MRDPVVVGTDGTAASRAAVRLAAREALSRACALQVVHAFTWPDQGTDYASARGAASRMLDEAVATVQRSTPGVDARGQLRDGPPARVLIGLSRSAALVVVGGDGLARLGSGSLVRTLVPESWCPVILARGPRPPVGPVLAAVDDSEFSALGLRFATEEAALRGSKLYAVHVIATYGPAARAAADRLLASVPESGRRILVGPPAATLVRLSRRAGLVVLGARGAGGARRLGSVAREVLRRGASPVVFAHAAVRPVH